jgi:hypothetical protein
MPSQAKRGAVVVSVLSRKYLSIIGLVAAVFALFVFVDIPQTVRIKALVINALPLDPQVKLDAVSNLCSAAYASSPVGIGTCTGAFWSKTALQQVRNDEQVRAWMQELKEIRARLESNAPERRQ